MMSRASMIVLTSLVFTAALTGQPAPRDADEVEAWKIYQQYKASRAAEAAASSAIRQVRNDVAGSSLSSIGVFGSDPGDRARLAQLRQSVDNERRRQTELLEQWGSKFYWRYGDLVWSEERVRDGKTKFEMDRIEFALTYFPFNYDPTKTVTTSPTPTPTAQPTVSAASTSLTLELPGYWGHLSYTITGAKLNPPTGGDRGNVAGRQYTGELAGPTLTISGTGISDNPTPAVSAFYELTASVTVGEETRNYRYQAPIGEKLNKPFSLSVPVTPGVPGSFRITLLYRGSQYGERGWVVSGNLKGSTTLSPVKSPDSTISTPAKPVVAIAGTWGCSDGGTYTITQSGTSIRWEAASADGGRTWAHSFVGVIQGDTIVGRFEDHASGQIRNRGDLTLRIVSGSKLEYVSSSVPFGGRVWSR